MNGAIILLAGYLNNNWNIALASMVSIYVTGKVLDLIHISHVKVTLYIITNETEAMLEEAVDPSTRRHKNQNARGIYRH